ncbi:MAG: HK97 gp10 family phage protein [candidate division WOR-3 bacterium]|nr:HK97 gp10 family phage protein [candidate division WOR-3 bacterium]
MVKDDEIRRILLKLGWAIVGEAKKTFIRNRSVDTGELLNSIIAEAQEDGSVIVGSKVVYAPAVEFGTRPHFPPTQPIKEWAHRKLGLEGEELEKATKSIQWKIYHEGTPGAPYLRPALNKAPELLKQILR